jgi:hypothetical protein
VSDPSGLNCTDILVADLGAGVKTGADFPTMAIDKAGNLYAVWEQAPIDASGNVIGDTVLRYSYSTDQGNTWAPPIAIDTSGSPLGTLHNNVFAWVVAGDDGRVNIVWYGTPGLSNPDDPTCGVNAILPPLQGKNINGPDSTTDAFWSLWMVQTLNPFGEAQIAYADSNNIIGAAVSHAMYVRQNGGDGLYAATSPVNIAGLTPFNGVSDPSGDGKYEVNGTSSANMPQLDILSSAMTKVTSAPCSAADPCYRVAMQLIPVPSPYPPPIVSQPWARTARSQSTSRFPA